MFSYLHKIVMDIVDKCLVMFNPISPGNILIDKEALTLYHKYLIKLIPQPYVVVFFTICGGSINYCQAKTWHRSDSDYTGSPLFGRIEGNNGLAHWQSGRWALDTMPIPDIY